MNVKIRKIPYWLTDVISLVSGIITIVSAIIGFYNINDMVRKLPNGKYEIVCNRWLVIMIVTFLFLLIIVSIRMRKYGQLLHNTRKVLTNNYYFFLHDFRNQYFDMVKEHKDNNDTEKRKVELLTRMTKEYLTKSLDYLCEIISSSSREEVSSCIKVIDNVGGDGNAININEALIRTFCRSRNTDGERISRDTINGKNKSVKIIDNTDFCDILMGESGSYFYQQDLLDYSKKLEQVGRVYKNSTPQYWKFYRGAVVAPIRVANEHLFFIDSNEDFDVVGFICVDTLSTNVFRKKDKSFYTNIVKAFAAETYVILNKYNFYLKKIKGEGKK